MTKPLAWLASLAVLAGCSSQLPTPTSQQLGKWGGTNMDIHDSTAANAVVADFTCFQAIFPAPTVIVNGHFELRGVAFAGGAFGSGTAGDSVTIDGTVSSNTMTVQVSLVGSVSAQFTLAKGGDLVRSGYCPLFRRS